LSFGETVSGFPSSAQAAFGVIPILLKRAKIVMIFWKEIMARKASGADQIVSAQELLQRAKTADELRTAQVVLLPLVLGLTLEQTVKAIGRSVGAICRLRTRTCKVARHERAAPGSKHALRNRAKATLEEEARILDEVLERAEHGEGIVIPPLREKIAERLGQPVALSTVYRILARNGWRKLAPNTAHPQGDASERIGWGERSEPQRETNRMAHGLK
jgi:hypothetical protein